MGTLEEFKQKNILTECGIGMMEYWLADWSLACHGMRDKIQPVYCYTLASQTEKRASLFGRPKPPCFTLQKLTVVTYIVGYNVSFLLVNT